MKKNTWIEIVFLASLIVFLTAVAFGFGEQSALKADDAAKNTLAQQYITALRLFALDHHGEYPYPGSVGTPICVGTGNPGGACEGGALENVPVESALATYLGSTNSDSAPLLIHGENYGGIGYVCSAADVLCKTYILFWNTHYKTACVNGASAGPSDSCAYTPQ